MRKLSKLLCYVVLPLIVVIAIGVFVINPPVPVCKIRVDLPINHADKCLSTSK